MGGRPPIHRTFRAKDTSPVAECLATRSRPKESLNWADYPISLQNLPDHPKWLAGDRSGPAALDGIRDSDFTFRGGRRPTACMACSNIPGPYRVARTRTVSGLRDEFIQLPGRPGRGNFDLHGDIGRH